ncbi:hypothetical protein, partial [Luteibacter sahnii]|uniref:hypothetical protein n=1 Tax=Luteibacter sahnii TaxID=3021977 RepID=UPI002A757776
MLGSGSRLLPPTLAASTSTSTSATATATATAKLPDYLGSAAAPPRAGSTVQDVEGIVGGVIDGVA